MAKVRKMYQCSFCGQSDGKTFREAREGKMIVICQDCYNRLEKEEKEKEKALKKYSK